jgi:hypothetical protein
MTVPTVLLATATATATATAAVVGPLLDIMPALMLTRSGVGVDALATSRETGSRKHTRARVALVAAQTELALLLVLSAFLLGRTLQRMSSVDPGFHADNVVAATVDVDRSRYRDIA